MSVCSYVKNSKTNISILCIFLMYAKYDNKDNDNVSVEVLIFKKVIEALF